MTTHKEADAEVAELKARYEKIKVVADEWVKKVDTLVKEWKLLDNTVNELNSWVAKGKSFVHKRALVKYQSQSEVISVSYTHLTLPTTPYV